MNKIEILHITVYIIWNIIVFLLYGFDKHKAKNREWRISENALLFSAVMMGGLGAFIGMKVFRHKTKHTKFKIGVPLAVFLNIAIIAVIIYWN